MCGRFVAATPPDELAAYFGATLAETFAEGGEPPPPNYNVAPTSDIYAVVDTPRGRELTVFHWGLVPVWAKDTKIGSKMINARAETLLEKRSFTPAFKQRRCIVPLDGFFEWKAPAGDAAGSKVKQPYFIHRLDGEPLAVAGLWERWRDKATPAGDEPLTLHSATLITVGANATMAPIHDRMPALLPASSWSQWLDPSNHDLVSLGELLVPAPNDLLTMHPVSTAVGNVRNKGPELIDPI